MSRLISVLFKMLEYYVLQAIKVAITSIPHTRGSVEGTRDISQACLVNIKNKNKNEPRHVISNNVAF